MRRFITLIVIMGMVLIWTGCGGGGDGVSSTWQVHTYNLTLGNGGALSDSSTDWLLLEFLASPSQPYPNAILSIDNASTVQVGVPFDADDTQVNISFSTMFSQDWDHPCKVTLTALSLKQGGLISGSVSGNLYADLDDDGDDEAYPLTATFSNVPILVAP